MKKKAILYVLLLVVTIFFGTTDVYAKEEKNSEISNIYTINLSTNSSSVYTASIIQISDCTGQNAVLGNVNDPDSVAWLLQKLLDYTRVIGPFIVLIMSSLDYLKAIFGSDEDSLKKANKHLMTRLVLVVALFLLPTLVSVLLNVFGFTSHEVCGLQ